MVATTSSRPESPSDQALASNKALLLLQRERELYDLRQLRGRAEEWLRAMYAMRPSMEAGSIAQTGSVPRLAQRATDLLLGDLSFEVAGVFEFAPSGGQALFQWFDPRELQNDQTLMQLQTSEFFEKNSKGVYDDGSVEALAPLAERLELKKFYWFWAPSYRGSRHLIVAGSSARTARFHALSETDLGHFVMFTTHVVALLNNGLLVADLKHERKELESMNRTLDESVKHLEAVQRQLVESSRMIAIASRKAGMAEIATGTLHNVGNVLNSVSVCAETSTRQVEALRSAALRRVVQLLTDQEDLPEFLANDPRGPTTLAYLQRFASHLDGCRTEALTELRQLRTYVEHVASIVSRQQEYATSSSVEVCSLQQLMDDALLLAQTAAQKGQVEVIREYAPVPNQRVDRHRVLQILVNLITNAVQALTDSRQAARRLTTRIGCQAGRARLEVQDNGVGIPAEVQRHLFTLGFTTRQDGHGFGLHTSWMTARELGGELSYQSRGLDQGARFILDLPLDAP